MATKPKPHIPDLKRKLKITFTHAQSHFDSKCPFNDSEAHVLRSREFSAALSLLDTLVVDDRFTSLGALNDCCWALVVYRKQLEEDGYRMKMREVNEFVKEIDAVREKEF